MHANPYFRQPVVLDEYVKNREVWQCPSAKLQNGALFIYGAPDWFQYLRDSEGVWGEGQAVCIKDGAYPRGWGGDVTDSVRQLRMAGGFVSHEITAHKAFVQSIGTNFGGFADTKMPEIQDPVQFILLEDAGACVMFTNPGLIAYPDLCVLECGNCWGWVDWEYCTWAADCGLYDLAPMNGSFINNVDLRKPYARHLGGTNIGFADGHARWWPSEAFLDAWAEEARPGFYAFGVYSWGAYSWCCANCGGTGVSPTLR
jgi:prepilin-type processing-associated H-X9-DG protein